MFLFYFFIIILYSECYKIAYIYNSGSETDISSVLTDYNTHKNGISTDDTDIEIISYNDYDGTELKRNEIFGKIFNEKISVILAYCDKPLYDIDQNILRRYEMLVWCLNPVGIMDCSRSFIPGSSFTATIESITDIVVYNNRDYVAFLGGSDEYGIDEYYMDRMFNLLLKFGKKLVISEIVNEENITNINDYLDEYIFTDDYKDDGITIVTTLTGSAFNSLMSKRDSDSPKSSIVVIPGGITQAYLINLAPNSDIFYVSNFWVEDKQDSYYYINYKSRSTNPEISVISYNNIYLECQY